MSTDLPFPKTSEGLSAHLDGELSPEETAVVEEWLRSSSEARQTLAKLRLIEQELKSFARDARQAVPALPAGWSDVVVAKIAAAQAASVDTDASSPVRPAFDLDDLPLSNAPQGDVFWRRAQFWQFAGACSAAAAILFALYAPAIAPGDAASANVAMAPAEPSPAEKLRSALKNLGGKPPTAGWAGTSNGESDHEVPPSTSGEGAPPAAGAPVSAAAPVPANARALAEERKELQANGAERKNLPGRVDQLKKAAELGDLRAADEVKGDGESSKDASYYRGGEGRNEVRGSDGMNRAADPKPAESNQAGSKQAENDEKSTEQKGRHADAAPAGRPIDAMREAGAAGEKAQDRGAGTAADQETRRFGAFKRSEKSEALEKQMQPAPGSAPAGGMGGAGGGGFRSLEGARKDGGLQRRGGGEPAVKLNEGVPAAAPTEFDRAAAPRTGGPAGTPPAPPRPAGRNQLEAEKVGVPAAAAPGAPAPVAPPAAMVAPTGEAGDAGSALRQRATPPGEAFKGAAAGKPQRGVPTPMAKEAADPELAGAPARGAVAPADAKRETDAKREAERKIASPAKPGAAEPAAARFAGADGANGAPATAPAAGTAAAPKQAAQEMAKSGADKDARRDAQRAPALGAAAPAPMVARSLPKERTPAGPPAAGLMGAASANGAPSAAAEVVQQAVPEPKLWIVSLEMSLPAVQSAALDQVLGEHKIPWQATDVAELSSDLTANTLSYQSNVVGGVRLGLDAKGAVGRNPAETAKSKPSNGEDSAAVAGKTAANAPADRPQPPPAVEAIWIEAPQEVVEEMVDRMRSKPEAFPKVSVRVWRSAAEAQTASRPSSDGLGRLPKAQADEALPADADLRLAAVSEGLRRPTGQAQQQQGYGFAQRMRVSSELETRLLARTDDAPVHRRKLLEGDKAKQDAQAFGAAAAPPATKAEGGEALVGRLKVEATPFDRSAPLRVLILVRAAAVR